MKNKKASSRKWDRDDDMLPEYDFSGGVRGKHHKAYRAGHTVSVGKDDGSVQVQHFTLADGAVLLESDVRKYFPDSDAVNRTLRTLITLLPAKPRQRVRK